MTATKAQTELIAEDTFALKGISTLRTWERNYRKGDVGKIAESIQRFGYNGALRVWRDNVVMAGNHALLALQAMKERGESAPIHVVETADDWYVKTIDLSHLNRMEAEAFAIADNHTQEIGSNDDATLTAMLEELARHDAELFKATAYDEETLKGLLATVGDSNPVEDESTVADVIDRAAELQEKWKVKAGDLYQIGSHKLLCGDSTDPQQVSRLMDGERAEAVITDPPFNVRSDNWDAFKDEQEFIEFTARWLGNVKESADVIACFMADKNVPALLLAAQGISLDYRRALIWQKPPGSQFAGASLDGFWFDFEIIQVFGGPKFKARQDTRMAVLPHRTVTGQEHGCEKPVALLVDIVEGYSQPDGIVLDLFNGVGTVMSACQSVGRSCYAIEQQEKMCAVTLERLSLLGLTPHLLP